jgi:DNA-binding MarR family transcriptional regulator
VSASRNRTGSTPRKTAPGGPSSTRDYQLAVRLNRHLLQDSGLTEADYVVLAVLSEHPTGRMPAQELCASLQWEKSRLSHQVRAWRSEG